ncbi:MAG: 50S ribosomal protein L9 [Bdellovibrionales bacterium]|nr:50S ribosomal protein L9 [Bdellovibrionales bacterium]
MEVILQENYPSLGYVGDIVRVRNGFARNFLIPKGIASEASSRNARELKHRLSNIEAKKRRLKGEAEEIAAKIAAESLTFTLKGSDRSRLFGSVTPKEIWNELSGRGYELERKQVKLLDPIKSAGEYTATVQLHADVSVEVALRIEVDTSSKKPTTGKRKAKANDDQSSEEDLSDAVMDDGVVGEESVVSEAGSDVSEEE